MTSKKTRRDCPVCGTAKAMVFEARDIPVEYKGHKRSHLVTTWWCTRCADGILEPEMIAENERIFVELRAQVDNVLLPEQVKAIRERLDISQREAGRVLGGGIHAFQKYESGETPVSEAMQNLLLLLDEDPRRLEELRRKRQGMERARLAAGARRSKGRAVARPAVPKARAPRRTA